MRFAVMVACTSTGGIGKNGKIPWHLSSDLRYFQKITMDAPNGKRNAVIMGRKTWDSLPKKPLAQRLNVVISSTITCNDMTPDRDVIVCASLDAALQQLESYNVHRVFVIGGGQVYDLAIHDQRCSYGYVTRVIEPHDIDCDVHFPLEEFQKHFTRVMVSEPQQEKGIKFVYEEYTRTNETDP